MRLNARSEYRLRSIPTAISITLAALVIWSIVLIGQAFVPFSFWLLDWHVYAAGARDFINHQLYLIPLVSQYPLPVDSFNYPPLSAIVVLPLFVLPDSVGGAIWVLVNIAAVALTGMLVARSLGVPQPLMWGAIGFLAYTIHPWMDLALLANNTPLVLLLVAAFAHQHLRGHDRSAGVVLGVAIGMKLWPVALVPLLLRERRWKSLMWTGAVVVATAVLSLLWLGFGAVQPAVSAIQVVGVADPWNPVLYVSWLRETFSWWPSWAAYVIAVGLVLIPARGLLGIGLGMLSGLAVVPNLWRTYLPTLVVAGLFVVAGMREFWLRRQSGANASHSAAAIGRMARMEQHGDEA